MTDQHHIYGRFSFDSFVSRELSRSCLTGRPLSMLLIEPRFLFSPRGHDTRHLEPLMTEIARTIKGRIRSSDLLCQYQQYRLAILLPETAAPHARELLGRILELLQSRYDNHAIHWYSAVVSPTDPDHNTPHALLQLAQSQLQQFFPGS